MLNHSSLRNLYKSADSIQSNHLVVAEWNMNKYFSIDKCGLYKGTNPTMSYSSTDPNIITGENKIVYTPGSGIVTKTDPNSLKFSQLGSVFQPNRPDPGIVFLQRYPDNNMLISDKLSNLNVRNLSVSSARYYLVSENKTYDYYNSAKILYLNNTSKEIGVSGRGGTINDVNPFVVYDSASPIFCNKIVIKVQNHICVPHKFSVDVLIESPGSPDPILTWTKAYAEALSSSSDFVDGVFTIYFNNGSWSKTIARMDDFDELISNSPTQLIKIKGIRFNLNQLDAVYPGADASNNIPMSLELIEISPRLEVDVTSYASSFNIQSSIGDSTLFGLPMGTMVAGAGSVDLSNEDGQFLFTSILSANKMLNEDVKFSFYQKVYLPPEYSPGGGETFNIPLGVLYSNKWNIGNDYSISVNLEDGMKFLRQLSAPDIIIPSRAALSAIILMILDNVGITGYEFKTSSNLRNRDGELNDVILKEEDTILKNFFCKKEQTVAEVLEQLAIATQCAIFYDVSGKLNVLTKERLMENAKIDESVSKVENAEQQKTDFWMVMTESDPSDFENDYIGTLAPTGKYTANVISVSEEKINPITDGDITYHFYGPNKVPLAGALADNQRKLYNQLAIDQFPMNSLALTNFDYATTILWRPPDDNSAVLGAANVIKDINETRLKDLYGDKNYTAYNEDDAIRQMYNDATKKTPAYRQSLIIYLDVNEGLTFPDFEGFILVDNEYIKYRGKLFDVGSVSGVFGKRIIFSEEEFNELKTLISKGDSILFQGLVVDVKFKNVDKDDEKYIYKVIGDGRAKFSSEAAKHFAFVEESDDIDPEKRFKLTLGESNNYNTPGGLDTSVRFNFLEKIRYKSLKKTLQLIPKENLNTYLGFLKIAGPKGPAGDTNALASILSASYTGTVSERLNNNNKEVDASIPQIPDPDNPDKFDEERSFHDYVYLLGEKSIYGQKITLPFAPNFLTTRMRLFSPRKKIFKDEQIMSTNSSIAGIGFGLNQQGEGYYLEVESAGSGKNFVEQENAFLNNLRFYKVYLKKNKGGKVVYTPELLLKASVGGFTVFDTAVEVVKSDDQSLDPVFELDIEIQQFKNARVFTIYYGDTKIGKYTEKIGEALNLNSQTIFMFVRNDSQAIYEYIGAAARPYQSDPGSYFRGKKIFERKMTQGIIPVNKSFLFKDDDNILFYFNDFAKLARQTKEYDVRFTAPALTSTILDISKVNPKFLIKKYLPTAFGAKIVITNISSGPVMVDGDETTPLYIVGIALEELNSGIVTAKEIYGKDDKDDDSLENKFRKDEREKNIAIYGEQTFSLDNQFIQTSNQAKLLMRWILKHCSRQRLKLSLEILENPLLELGDKIKIFDKSRGFTKNNFGDRTFVISSISRSVTSAGPSMNVTLIEVGEA